MFTTLRYWKKNIIEAFALLHFEIVPRSLTLLFEPFRFWLRICWDIRNRKTTPWLVESGSRQLGVYMSERLHIYKGLKKSSSACPGGSQQLEIPPSTKSKRAPNFSADIFARPGDFNARQDSIAHLYFCQTPIFCIPANIFMKRQYFHESPIFSWVAGNFMSRQYFGYLPIYSWVANNFMCCEYFVYSLIFWKGANILWICLILLLQIFVYIISIYLCIWVCADIFGAIVLTLGLRMILW